MTRKNNLLNRRFGRLVVIKATKSDNQGNACWLCQCDCGRQTITVGSRLCNGTTKSCGCLRREVTKRQFMKNRAMQYYLGRTTSLVNEDGVSFSSLIKSVRNRSGHVGVSYDEKSGRWFARLFYQKHYVLLKSFDTLQGAINAREKAEKQYFTQSKKMKTSSK